MPRPSPRLVAACALVLAALAEWFAVAAFLDARNAPQLQDTDFPASFAWWTVAGAGTPLAILGLGLVATALAAWARYADPRARVLAAPALAAAAVMSAAIVIVGVASLAEYASGPSLLIGPNNTALAKFASMTVGGLVLLTAAAAAAAPSRPFGAGPRRAAVGVGVVLALVLGAGGAEAADRTTHVPPARAIELFSSNITLPPATPAPPPVVTVDDRITSLLEPMSDVPGVDPDADCDDSALDVAGTHHPRNCHAIAASLTGQDGGSNQIWVEKFASPREAAYQYGVELRYERQYPGLRSDRAIPGIAGSRMIHTGDVGNFFAVVVRDGSRLIIEFVSSEGYETGPVSKADMDSAVALARQILGMLNR